MSGWIRLHLSVVDNEVWRHDELGWRVFEYLCLMAYKGKPQGTTRTSRQQIGNALSRDSSSCWKAFLRLEKAKMVTHVGTGRYSLVTICKWHEYQSNQGQVEGQLKDSSRTAQGHSYKNKIKNKEKDTNVSSSTNVDIKALFSELIGILGYTDAVKYTDGRKRKLQARVRAGSADELRRAAQAIAADAYMQGDNPAGRRYGDIDYLIRSDEQVDKWIQKAKQQVTYQADW